MSRPPERGGSPPAVTVIVGVVVGLTFLFGFGNVPALVGSVGPLLLIGWAEVGPGLLHALAEGHRAAEQSPAVPAATEMREPSSMIPRTAAGDLDSTLVERARQVDAQQRARWLLHEVHGLALAA